MQEFGRPAATPSILHSTLMLIAIRIAIFLCCLIVGDITSGQSLADSLRPLIDRHEGDVSVAIRHLSGDQSFAFRGDEPMPTASLIKFPLMVAAYQMVDRGELDLSKKIVLSDRDKVQGSGILTPHFSAGTMISVRDAIELMMVYSDNTATNLVIDQVGLKETAALMESLGCPNTKMHAKVFRRDTSIFPDRSRRFGLGSTTANEMVQLLTLLHRDELVSEAASREMLSHMRRCDSDDKLPRLLPAGTKIAHKTGAVSAVRCDAGIVFGPDEDAFAICVLTRKNKDQRWTAENAANVLCGQIAKVAFDHFFADKVADPLQPRTLQIGAGGLLVEALQRTLNARMDPSPEISIDGDFGPDTEATVRRFQRQHRLTDSGKVDRATWEALGTLLDKEEPVPDPMVINATTIEKSPPDRLHGPPHVTCKAWAIGDGKSGAFLFGNSQNVALPMASTTKIMTAYVVLQAVRDDESLLDELVTFSEAADTTIGSTSGIRVGESISVGELLYGLLLPSGNDASVALAEHFGRKFSAEEDDSGPIDPVGRFVQAMNQAAADLDMTSTHFKNTHGLSVEGHRSSAQDLMTLAWRAMQDERFRLYVGTAQRGCTVTGPGGYRRNLLWKNTNRLLRTEGYDGVKTGTTGAAGACLVSRCERGNDSLIVVVLGSASSDARYADTRNLYRWGFEQVKQEPPPNQR